MSTITLNFVETSDTPEQIYHHNHEFLKTNFKEILDEIKKTIENINPDLKNNFQSLTQLESLAEKIIQSYTLGTVLSGLSDDYISENTSKFNQEAMNVKIQLRSLDLETQAAKKEFSALQIKIEKEISKLTPEEKNAFNTRLQEINNVSSPTQQAQLTRSLLSEIEAQICFNTLINDVTSIINGIQEIPPGFKSEYELICSSLKNIKNEKSLDFKITKINELSNQVVKFCRDVKIAQSIDISGLTEHKLEISKFENSEDNYLILDIDKFFGRIQNLDDEISKRLKPLKEECAQNPHRLNIIRTEFQIQYGQILKKIAESEIIHEELRILENKLKNIPGSEQLIDQTQLLMKEKYPDSNRYNKLIKDVEKHTLKTHNTLNDKSKEDIIPNILETLGKLGYSVRSNTINLSVKPGEELYLDTNREHYKLKLQMRDTGEILYCLVRVVSSEKEIEPTRYQEQTDIEAGHKWCKDYDKLTEELQKVGIRQKTTMRLEPEDEPIKVEIRPDMIHNVTDKKEEKSMKDTRSF